MKKFLLPLLAFSFLACASSAEKGESKSTDQKTDKCAEYHAKAERDFEKGVYTVTQYGMMKADDGEYEFYTNFMKENYNVDVGNPGCEVEEDVECYSTKIEELLKEKHGNDFFTRTRTEATNAFSKSMSGDTMVLHCQLVEKEFYKKNGKPAGFTELYLRASVQDYFIKLCESNVTKEDFAPYLHKDTDNKEELDLRIPKGISVQVILSEGEWDICAGDPEMQSRIGMYAAVLKILE
jgi:hypothetical protein